MQGSKLLGDDGNPNLKAGIVRLIDNLQLGFFDRKPRNCLENPNSEAGFPNGNPNFNCNF